jgi:hypothetical protein
MQKSINISRIKTNVAIEWCTNNISSTRYYIPRGKGANYSISIGGIGWNIKESNQEVVCTLEDEKLFAFLLLTI